MNFKERLLLLLMIEAVGLFCQNSIRKCSKEVSNCPITKELWYKRYEEFPCFKEGLNYTCMMAVGGVLVEACINDYEIRAFTGSRCPFIHSCDGIEPVLAIEGNWPLCPEDVFGCPPADHPVYTVYHMYKYPACIVRNVTELLTTKTTTLEVLTSPTTHATVANVTTTNTTNGQVTYNEMPGIVAGVIIGAVFVLLSIVAAVCIWKISRIRRGKRKRVDDQLELCIITPGTNGVSDPLLPESDETYLKNPSTQPDLDTEEKTMHMPPDPEETYLKRPSTPPDSDTKEKTMHMPPDPDTALLVSTSVTVVHPSHLEKETKEKVEAILLSVLEIMFCKEIGTGINEDEVSALFDMFNDLQIISKKFLDIWHGQFCKCGKHFGQKMLLKFIESAADQCSHGKDKFDHFKVHVIPYLVSTLKISTRNIYHIFEDCGAIPVSVVQSSVHSYWKFDCIRNLDMLWDKYSNGELNNALQDSFNSTEVLCLLKVDKISFKMEILQKDFIKYRATLEKTAADADRLKTPDITEKITEKASVESTTKDIVKGTVKTPKEDLVVDTVEVLKLDHAKRTDKTPETGFLKHFEKIEPSLKDPLSDPDMAQLQRGELPMSIDLMKKRLYEINKSLSETPTVLSYLLHSGDKIKREPLYASVSLLEYDNVQNVLYSRQSTKIENIPDHIFCTSDENHWKRGSFMSEERYIERYKDRYKVRHIERYKDSNTNSTCVIILGEARCGKTSYCLHLLRQWCRGEELQKFDKVFYVDTSVLQTPKTSMSDIISTAVFGNRIFSENQVDCVLGNEKCLILIDGDEYFRHSFLRECRKLLMEYCNCVFVFLMRPIHFKSAESFYVFKLLEDNVSFIQLLGLDEKGMTSLYSDVTIESNKMKQSERGHEIKKGGDSQQIMNKPTLQDERGEPDTALSVTESYLFQSKGESDTQAYIAQNPTDLEQLVKNPDSRDFAQEEETKPKTEKDVSKHDRKELEFYKIKGKLEKGLRENYDLIMKIPMLGSVYVGLLAEGKDLPRNFTNLYFCLIDKLLGGHESLSGGKGEKGIEHFDLFLPYENVHRHVETLRKLGKMAYNSIFSAASQFVNYKTLDRYLEETEIDFAIRTGLLVSVQTVAGKTSDEQNVRFLHKTIQDSLVSMYIFMEKEEALDSVCQHLTSIDVIIDVSHVIMMVCGLNPNLGCRITRSIKDVLDKDENVIRHRQNLIMDSFVREFYYLQLSWYSEYKDKVSNIESDTKDSFYVSDIYVDDETDKDTVNKTIVLLSDKNVIVTSLNIIDVPAENGLSDKVLNDFLALNTSLESLYVRKWQPYRTIEPLSFPILTVLTLWNVDIRPASSDDETTKPLLYHLPMLQRLDLYNIELNNRILGLTSNEGRMPMLKKVKIIAVDMNDQSIELAPDMTDIEDIYFADVKMSPPGWMKFIRSLLNIRHSYRVRLYDSDIDVKSLDKVRTDKNFEMEREGIVFLTSFVRVWPLT